MHSCYFRFLLMFKINFSINNQHLHKGLNYSSFSFGVNFIKVLDVFVSFGGVLIDRDCQILRLVLLFVIIRHIFAINTIFSAPLKFPINSVLLEEAISRKFLPFLGRSVELLMAQRLKIALTICFPRVSD